MLLWEVVTLHIDLQFVAEISHHLAGIRAQGGYKWLFRCPICGDSQKFSRKTRGSIFRAETGDHLKFHCYNCGENMPFGEFIKTLDPDVYKKYQMALFMEKYGTKKQEKAPDPVYTGKAPVFKPRDPNIKLLDDCPTINSLADNHPAKQYLNKRMIPKEFYDLLRYTEDFRELALRLDPTQTLLKSEPRIVIPFLDENKFLLAVQGRSLSAGGIRYLTAKTNPSNPKIFGLDRVDRKKRIYVTEGPFDSMFIPNCLAAGGADILQMRLPKDGSLIVFDNEPRNSQITARMEQMVKNGYRIFIWPSTIKHKDINDLVLSGYQQSRLQFLIDSNSYTGMEARIKLAQWKR